MSNDGGPAFPVPVAHDPQRGINADAGWYLVSNGLGGASLRDYFAAHAPEAPEWFAFMGKPDMSFYPNRKEYDRQLDIYHQRRFVAWRWAYANMMIDEREKGTKP